MTTGLEGMKEDRTVPDRTEALLGVPGSESSRQEWDLR